jgi:hypothetical protein
MLDQDRQINFTLNARGHRGVPIQNLLNAKFMNFIEGSPLKAPAYAPRCGRMAYEPAFRGHVPEDVQDERPV